jgi:hypothetical protein
VKGNTCFLFISPVLMSRGPGPVLTKDCRVDEYAWYRCRRYAARLVVYMGKRLCFMFRTLNSFALQLHVAKVNCCDSVGDDFCTT